MRFQLAAALSGLLLVQGAPVDSSTASSALAPTSTAPSSASGSGTSASPTAVPAAATSGGATATNTQLLPVPSYATASSFAPAAASGLAINIPAYTFNLTSVSNATRTGLCAQTVQYCASSKCSSSSANVTTNFCNPVTMGWNCACSDGATSRLQPPVVPINSVDCQLRASVCKDQCSNPSATPAIKSLTLCNNACSYIIGSTCGTNTQFIPLYQVSSYNDKPKYYPDTSKGGVAAGITTSSSDAIRRIASPLLAVLGAGVVGGLMVLL